MKYGARLTAVPLIMAGARIPGTMMPTFGLVSAKGQQWLEDGRQQTYSCQ